MIASQTSYALCRDRSLAPRGIGKNGFGNWRARSGISKRRSRTCGKPRIREGIARLVVEVGRKVVALPTIEHEESPITVTVLEIGLGRTPW
jgi:hypothetical protein